MSARIFKAPVLANTGVGIIANRHADYIALQTLEEWYHPVAIDANYIVETTAMPTGAAGVDIPAASLAHQPDFARNVTAVADAAQTAHIIVYGTDVEGAAISEELTLNGTSTVTGAKAFETITSIHLNQRSGAANITVGVGNVLGLLRAPRNFLPEGLVDEVLEGTLPTLNVTNETVVFNTALADTKVYTLKYWASEIS